MKLYLQLIIFVSIAFCSTLSAQIYVNNAATGSNDGTTWDNAYTDLQSALDVTTASDIWIAQGVYKPALRDSVFMFESVVGHSLYGGFIGNEAELDDRDFILNNTILSGDIGDDDVEGMYDMNKTDNAVHILYVGDHGETVTVDGINFRNGSTVLFEDETLGTFWYRGGAIYTLSPLQIDNCLFTENSGFTGSAVYILGTTNSSVENSTFEKNFSLTQASLQLTQCMTPSVSNCRFIENIVTRGAAYTNSCTEASFTDCDFLENSIQPGGFGGAGFYNFSSVGTTLTNCNFIGNTSTNNAAVLYCDGSAFGEDFPLNLTLTDCFFRDNESIGFGGNIYFWTSNYIMDGCTIENNSAPNGGGIYHGNSRFDVRNTEFIGNTASFGAATLNYSALTEGKYSNCLFENNMSETSGGGGMIGFGAQVDFEDCDFEGNSATFGGVFYCQNENSEINFADCDFIGNSAVNQGGVLINFGGNQLKFDECLFSGNSSGIGGAMSIIDDTLDIATLDINNSIFDFNFADAQGGAINLGNVDATIRYSQITNNQALDVGTGGAISNNAFNDQDARLNIIHCTIADNAGDLAAGLANFNDDAFSGEAVITLANTILWNANGGFGYAVEAGSNTSLISNGGNHYLNPLLEDLFTGENDFFDDVPGFTDSGDGDYSLKSTSVCIDQGLAISGVTSDIEGNPIKNAPDKGCYEFQGNVSTKYVIKEDIGKLLSNPTVANTILEFSHDYIGQIEINIFSITGKLVKQFTHTKDAESTNVFMNVASLEAGTFLVEVNLGQNSFSKKLIKL